MLSLSSNYSLSHFQREIVPKRCSLRHWHRINYIFFWSRICFLSGILCHLRFWFMGLCFFSSRVLPLSVSLLLLLVCLHQFSVSGARASGPCVCHRRGALWGGCGPPAARFGIMSASEAADGSSTGLCPSFAVICSFLERYGALLDLPEVSFPMLERSLQESSAGEPLLHCCSLAALHAFKRTAQ